MIQYSTLNNSTCKSILLWWWYHTTVVRFWPWLSAGPNEPLLAYSQKVVYCKLLGNYCLHKKNDSSTAYHNLRIIYKAISELTPFKFLILKIRPPTHLERPSEWNFIKYFLISSNQNLYNFYPTVPTLYHLIRNTISFFQRTTNFSQQSYHSSTKSDY